MNKLSVTIVLLLAGAAACGGKSSTVKSNFTADSKNHLTDGFSSDQQPLSESLKKSFPKIKASCFFIANKKAGVVLHEKNSTKNIHSVKFCQMQMPFVK